MADESFKDELSAVFTSYTDTLVGMIHNLQDKIDILETRIKNLENSIPLHQNYIDTTSPITYDEFMANADSFTEE